MFITPKSATARISHTKHTPMCHKQNNIKTICIRFFLTIHILSAVSKLFSQLHVHICVKRVKMMTDWQQNLFVQACMEVI